MSCLLFIIFTGSPTLGEHFNPAKDCSDIVDNLPEATDGFYWIKPTKGELCKVNMHYEYPDIDLTRPVKGVVIFIGGGGGGRELRVVSGTIFNILVEQN